MKPLQRRNDYTKSACAAPAWTTGSGDAMMAAFSVQAQSLKDYMNSAKKTVDKYKGVTGNRLKI